MLQLLSEAWVGGSRGGDVGGLDKELQFQTQIYRGLGRSMLRLVTLPAPLSSGFAPATSRLKSCTVEPWQISTRMRSRTC